MAFLLVLVEVLEYSKVCRLGLSRQGGFAWSPSGGLFVVRRVDVASRQRKQQENSVVVLYTVSGSKGCVGLNPTTLTAFTPMGFYADIMRNTDEWPSDTNYD